MIVPTISKIPSLSHWVTWPKTLGSQVLSLCISNDHDLVSMFKAIIQIYFKYFLWALTLLSTCFFSLITSVTTSFWLCHDLQSNAPSTLSQFMFPFLPYFPSETIWNTWSIVSVIFLPMLQILFPFCFIHYSPLRKLSNWMRVTICFLDTTLSSATCTQRKITQ